MVKYVFVYSFKTFWYQCEILASENTKNEIGNSNDQLLKVVPESLHSFTSCFPVHVKKLWFIFCYHFPYLYLQVDNDDLVSLNNVETTDFETEQLISEIELLTSRALQETQQWGSSQHQSSSPAKPSKTTVLVEANNNPTTTESTSWTLAN